MADVWGDFEADVADIIQADGDTVTIATNTATFDVLVFWQSDSVEDEGLGPRFDVATADLPSDVSYGDKVTRDSVDYRIGRFLPDGHGLTTVLLTD